MPEALQRDAPTIYLAGPIDNVSDDDARQWRVTAELMLGDDADVVDPCEENPGWPDTPEGKRELREWDFQQVRQADAVLVGNMDPTIPTRGTSMEIREAETHGVPVVVQSPDPGDMSNFVGVAATGVHTELNSAVRDVLAIANNQAEREGSAHA